MSDVGLFLLMFAGLLLMLGIIRFLAWLTELQNEHGSLTRAGVHTVKRYVSVERPVMAREDDSEPVYVPPSLQTNSRQTPDRPAPVVPGRAELLTLFKALRAAGIKRDDIRPALKGVGLPLDNNLWTEAAPLEEEHITPIVGRRTDARFETDADYPYQPMR